jgi:hypothetical protein
VFKSFRRSLLVSFETITVLTLVLSILSVRAVFAAAGGIPGRPTPPPPPCISTGPIFEFPAGCYSCQVRNVSANDHNATIDLRNEQNQSEDTTPPVFLSRGRSIITSFCGNGFLSVSCVVTTLEGTTDDLNDLAVVEQYAPAKPGANVSISTSASETEGKIYNSCMPSEGPVGPRP